MLTDRYTLLGPSGCGKTTLLEIITDQATLQAGIIQKPWKSKSEIGFMPQVTIQANLW